MTENLSRCVFIYSILEISFINTMYIVYPTKRIKAHQMIDSRNGINRKNVLGFFSEDKTENE